MTQTDFNKNVGVSTKHPSSAISLVDQIRRGKVRCVDVVRSCLERIAVLEPRVHAFISVNDDLALERAAFLDDLDEDSKARMPLLGVPVAVKDNICTAGIPTTCASKMLQHFIPPYNATVVEALLSAGAVIVGKTNLDEFAMGSSTETSFFGPTYNPHDPSRTPGGSSGGSAAAVAAGEVLLSVGSDTGGSIRQPCSHCGVVGLKPTYGRVSRYGLVAFASSLDQIGPIATNAHDLGLLLEVMSIPDVRDSTNARKPFRVDQAMYSSDLRGFTIGIPQEYFGDGLHPDVRNAIELLIEQLKGYGASFCTVSLPNLHYAIAAYYIICTAEASSNLARYDGVKYGFRTADSKVSLNDMYTATRAQGFGAEVKRRIILGTYVLSAGYYDAYYLKAARVRTLITNDFKTAFKKCQAIISPVAPTAAFKLGEKVNSPLEMYLSDVYTVSANLAGIPAICAPCTTIDGLPVGVQFMSPHWREDTLLQLAYAVEQCRLN